MDLPADLPRTPFAAEVYRVSRAGMDPLSTEGSRAVGRRFNPPRDFGALYCSLKRETAIAEVARNLTRRGIALASIPPGEFQVYTLRLALARVLDLTNPEIRARLSVSMDMLCGEDPAVTRQIAARARTAGYQALLVPSVAHETGKNLVVFLEDLDRSPEVISSESVDFASPSP